MPAVRPLPPASIRKLLEAKQYRLIGQDAHNWAFAVGEDDAPVVVPYNVDLVPVEVAFHIARLVGFNDYFEAVYVDDPFPPDAEGTTPASK